MEDLDALIRFGFVFSVFILSFRSSGFIWTPNVHSAKQVGPKHLVVD